MNWISGPLTKYWRNVHLALIALMAVVLIYNHQVVNGIVSDLAIQIFHTQFAKLKTSVMQLMEVNEENQRLRLRLTEAEARIWDLEEDRQENTRLRTMLGFEPPAGYSLLPVRIISVFGDEIPSSAVINRGSEDSIFINQPVINEDGLIGRVVTVMSDCATVQLLTDPTNRVAARVSSNRDMGIARTTVSEGMVMDNVPIQGTVQIGDTIISSGLGGVYPNGLLVGTVVAVDRPEDEPFCRVHLETAVDFFSLDELFVLVPESR